MENQTKENIPSGQTQTSEEKEFSTRAVIWGVVLGILLLGVSMAVLVMTGIGVGMSPVAALLALAVLPLIGGKASKKEVNIVQTIASAVTVGGSVVTSTLAAMLMGGSEFNFLSFVTAILLSGVVGICMVSLFRKRMVEDPAMPFPQAIACMTVVEKVDKTSKKEMRILLLSILAGIGISALYNFGIIPMSLNMTGVLPKGMLLGISFMPLLFGIGYLIGFKTSAIMLIGALVSNMVLSVIGTNAGWYPDPATMEGAAAMQQFNLSLVIGIAFAGAMVPLIKQGARSVKHKKTAAGPSATGKDLEIPVNLLCFIGSAALVAIVVYYRAALQVNPVLTLIAELGMVVIAYMDIRCMGESGLTISGLFSLVMIFILGNILKDAALTLFVMTISVSMMGLAGDTMTDLKTGHMIGASPRKQMWCQFIGLVPGAILSVLILFLIVKTRGIGTAEAPFPNAAMFFGMAQGASMGAGSIMNVTRLIIGAAVGTGVAVFDLPAVALALSFYLPIAYIISIFIGGAVRGLLEKKRGAEVANVWVNAASGLIISDGFITMIAMAIQFLGQ